MELAIEPVNEEPEKLVIYTRYKTRFIYWLISLPYMVLCIWITLIGLLLILDSLFDVIRKFGIKFPRKYTKYFAPIGFLLIITGIFLNQRGIC